MDHDYKNYPELTNTQLNEFQFTSPHVQITEDFKATVVKVHDGDTITLRTDFRDFDFPLRFLEIDAPELNEGGKEATEWLKSRLLGKEVTIEINSLNRVGKYGRLLGIVFLDGLNVGEEMQHLTLVKEFGKKKESEIEPIGKMIKEASIA